MLYARIVELGDKSLIYIENEKKETIDIYEVKKIEFVKHEGGKDEGKRHSGKNDN